MRRLHRTDFALLLLAAMLAAMPSLANAQTTKPGDEQVVVPEVERRDVRLPRIPSNDFEAGVFAGTYSTQNFGASAVAGIRLGYHLTEDFFVEGVYAQTKVSDDSFRQILPGGVFADGEEKLSYYNLSAGYNCYPARCSSARAARKPPRST